MNVDNTLTKGAVVLEYLYENDFKAKSVDRISTEFGIPSSTVYRILQSWKQAGWVVEVRKPSGKGVLWQISKKLVSMSFAYERHIKNRVNDLKSEFKETAGKEL